MVHIKKKKKREGEKRETKQNLEKKSKLSVSFILIPQWILILSAVLSLPLTLPSTITFEFSQSNGQSIRWLKDHGLHVSNNWAGTGWPPLIRLPYVSVSCLAWNAAPFSVSPTSCLSFPDLGSMTSVSLFGELEAILLLMSVCLSTSQGGFCSLVRRKCWSIKHMCPFFGGNGK